MSLERKPVADDPPEVPAWIVSFSDMITLLLSFFVMLQAFAKEQRPDLFFVGQGSFRRAIDGLGVPDLLFGKQESVQFTGSRVRYPSREERSPEDPPQNVEEIRAQTRYVFQNLKELMDEVEVSDAREQVIDHTALQLSFSVSSRQLAPEARKSLRQFADDVNETHDPGRAMVYVIGLAADQTPPDPWTASARRARLVDDALRSLLPGPWEVYSWGAGPGGDWSRTFGLDPTRSNIVLVVMRKN